jgi:hypothetical protein
MLGVGTLRHVDVDHAGMMRDIGHDIGVERFT